MKLNKITGILILSLILFGGFSLSARAVDAMSGATNDTATNIDDTNAQASMDNTKLAKFITLSIGKSDSVIAGENKKIDSTNNEVVPFIDGGRTFVPVRFIAEALGKNIFYDNGLIISSTDIKINASSDKQTVDMLKNRLSGQKPNGPGGNVQMPDISGEVSATSSGQITIKLTEMPKFNGSQQQGQTPTTGQTTPDANGQQGQKGQGGTPPAMKYTGETKIITLSAGISITTISRGEQGTQNTTIAAEDIKVGDMLNAWYGDKEKKNITKISIMQKRQ